MKPLLQSMQAEVDGRQLENKRKDATIDTFKLEEERLNNKLKMQEGSHTHIFSWG